MCSCHSVVQSYPTLCNSMDCSTPGFPVLHHLPEFAQTYVHWVSDAIQPSHPLSSPSPPAFNLSQHQGLFKWVGSSHQMAKALELQLQHQSFQWIFRFDFLRDVDWLDFLTVHRTLKSLLQDHNSKTLILQRPVFFMVQLSHPYLTKGIPDNTKNTEWTTFEFFLLFWPSKTNKWTYCYVIFTGGQNSTIYWRE